MWLLLKQKFLSFEGRGPFENLLKAVKTLPEECTYRRFTPLPANVKLQAM